MIHMDKDYAEELVEKIKKEVIDNYGETENLTYQVNTLDEHIYTVDIISEDTDMSSASTIFRIIDKEDRIAYTYTDGEHVIININ